MAAAATVAWSSRTTADEGIVLEWNDRSVRVRIQFDDPPKTLGEVKSLIRARLGNDAERYGLRLDEEWDRQPAERPLVVLLHGYNAGPSSLGGLHAAIVERKWPCGMFVYPNDGPLAGAAVLLAGELARFRKEHPDRKVVLVGHSMGGLVARGAIENPDLDPGNVARLVMVFTPNQGSRWAELPGGLDGWEHFVKRPEPANQPGAAKQPDPADGPQTVEDPEPADAREPDARPDEESRTSTTLADRFLESLVDGLNEARADLKPGSKFLRELNARERNPLVRYSLILGTGAPLTAERIAQTHEAIRGTLADTRAGQRILPRVDGFFEGLDELETGKGDGAVSVERGKLDGVEDTLLLPVPHWALGGRMTSPAEVRLRDAILERLAAE